MENRLLTVAKDRVMDELEASLQRHPRYKNIQVYHKFHTLKERQQAGVILRGASASRQKMSADDCIGTLSSLCYVANLQGFPGSSIEWVWEDGKNITALNKEVDVTSLLARDMRTIQFPATVTLASGPANPVPAYNFAQVEATVDGSSVDAYSVDGTTGKVVLAKPLPLPTRRYTERDVTSFLQPDMKTLVLDTIITAAHYTLTPATLAEQVGVSVGGFSAAVTTVNGAAGTVVLTNAVPAATTVTMAYCAPADPAVAESTLLLTYYSVSMDQPGFYFLQMDTDTTYNITPLHLVEDEKVISLTTGLETSATLLHNPVNTDSPYYLYTKKYQASNKVLLEPGTDYVLHSSGVIDFLTPLKAETTLYASYRWQGQNRGPFTLGTPAEINSGENLSDNSSIKGVTMAFGTRAVAGDKQVIYLGNKRTDTARVMGGHYNMQFEILVYTRDPQSLSEVVDHLVSDLWGNRRQGLIGEGYSITDMDPTGEAEESYDDAAGIMYFQHSISLSMITEWKKFEPFMATVKKINLTLHRYPEPESLEFSPLGMPEVYTLIPFGNGFEVVYPKGGYPKI